MCGTKSSTHNLCTFVCIEWISALCSISVMVPVLVSVLRFGALAIVAAKEALDCLKASRSMSKLLAVLRTKLEHILALERMDLSQKLGENGHIGFTSLHSNAATSISRTVCICWAIWSFVSKLFKWRSACSLSLCRHPQNNDQSPDE